MKKKNVQVVLYYGTVAEIPEDVYKRADKVTVRETEYTVIKDRSGKPTPRSFSALGSR